MTNARSEIGGLTGLDRPLRWDGSNLSRELVAGAGDMGDRIRMMDWSKTPLGPIDEWSSSLRTMVSFMLANRFPLLLWWGPDYISIYNDAYRPVLGTKHPWALGKPVRECWAEIWDVLKPLIDTPFLGGPPTWSEDLSLELNRYGFLEETHFTVAYSPVPDESAPTGIGGVLATVHEITEKIVGERRITALRDLAARSGEAKTAEEACSIAAQALGSHAKDVPFAALYLFDQRLMTARLAGATGVEPGDPAAPLSLSVGGTNGTDEPWPIAEMIRSESMIVVENLAGRLAKVPPGPWADPPHSAVVAPIKSNVGHQLAGIFVAGISPRLKLDEQYRSFLGLLGSQLASIIATARAYEEERKRAEALAEIDRAKTLFFSNVSHEFRTPLTLMLGPLEDALARADLAPNARHSLDVAHRNSLRLLKLVNSLLDFSRIEAGRAQASYEAVDLAAFTEELASNFRSACERAGIELIVDCAPLPVPVYVDRDMWEKIVLNLLSNAFKFTFEGHIAVRLRAAGGAAELLVEDTGVGIAEQELPRLFERFHRIEGQRSRTHEGSGIGLALVQELVKLHHGDIRVESKPGRGTAFTISIPFGHAHLPAERLGAPRTLAPTSVQGQAYVQEALRWLPGDQSPEGATDLLEREVMPARSIAMPASGGKATVLVVDDNADMREYVKRLMAPRYDVQTAADGSAALAEVRRLRPDLVLSDVMMPGLDGFGLVRAIRADPLLADLPVVLLSARAGQEANIEGLEAGADDYLIKPFGAQELLARVASNIQMAHLRRDLEGRLAADLAAMQRLYEAGNLCVRSNSSFDECLTHLLDAAIAITGADKGNIQLLDPAAGGLRIAVQRGFEKPFLDFFSLVEDGEGSSCGAALQASGRVVVEDVTRSDIFVGTPSLAVMVEAGALAVQSTPLRSSTGAVLGMISTHFARPYRPTEPQLRFMDLLARQAADYLERVASEATLETTQRELRKSDEQLRAYLTASFDVVYRMSADWTVMRHLEGKEFIPDTIEPSSTWLDKYIHPEDQALVMAAIQHAIRTKSVFELEHRVRRADGGLGWTLSRAIPLLDENGEIVEWLGTAADVTARKQYEQRQGLLLNELNHRVKNTLAAVQSIAMQTLRDASSTADARKALQARLLALAAAHDVLTRGQWEGADIYEVIRGSLAAYQTDGKEARLNVKGPNIHLLPRAALALSMALHELATNAAKYGALSNGSGRIDVGWSISADLRAFSFRWAESGGPPVKAPQKRGFGSRLIERGLAQDLDGDIRLDFEPSGLICTIAAPVDEIVKDMQGHAS